MQSVAVYLMQNYCGISCKVEIMTQYFHRSVERKNLFHLNDPEITQDVDK